MEQPELDEKDLAIIKILQEDGRASYKDIARKLNMHENTVRFRVRRLIEKGVIRGIVAIVDPRKLGLKASAAMMLKLETDKMEEALSTLKEMKEITNIYQFSGEYDLILVVFGRDLKHLEEIRKRIKRVRGVRDVNMLITTNIIKSEIRYSLT